jgi:indole-3-glycerol phosphate synthase
VSILDEILAHKREEVAVLCAGEAGRTMARQAEAIETPPRGFRRSLQATRGVSVIAEVKRRSPSKGLIREDFDPAWIAARYEQSGAACISVLTDEKFFGGCLADLEAVRKAVSLPVIRKDFVVHTFQIDEARVAGADAILLIVAALDDRLLRELHDRARALGLDVLVEVHDEVELERARALGADLIGVNNRNLKSFEVDLATTERLARCLFAEGADPEVVLVAESGIASSDDVRRLERAGAAGFLVGESLMRQADPGQALRALRGSESGREGSPA